MTEDQLYRDAVGLLKQMISTPSFSREEDDVADLITDFFFEQKICVHRIGNNLVAYNRYFSSDLQTILLNSHIDTVKPTVSYTRDPFSADVEGDILYGLGSNDAGASVVSLIATFIHFYNCKDLKKNICLVISAEEESSGSGGLESVLPTLEPIEFAIVGEPTGMNMAIGERGLVVLDCVAHGKAGHAARREGVNAITEATKDIHWFSNYQFPRKSELFENVDMNVTIISAGIQHNVIPAECRFTVDVRVTDCYTNEEVVEIIRQNVKCDVEPRSLRLRSSHIEKNHPIVQTGISLGLTTYASPTMSDQAFLTVPSLKIGPGESNRSHGANEYIKLSEIENAIKTYIALIGHETLAKK